MNMARLRPHFFRGSNSEQFRPAPKISLHNGLGLEGVLMSGPGASAIRYAPSRRALDVGDFVIQFREIPIQPLKFLNRALNASGAKARNTVIVLRNLLALPKRGSFTRPISSGYGRAHDRLYESAFDPRLGTGPLDQSQPRVRALAAEAELLEAAAKTSSDGECQNCARPQVRCVQAVPQSARRILGAATFPGLACAFPLMSANAPHDGQDNCHTR
jgi:hypothetical protein